MKKKLLKFNKKFLKHYNEDKGWSDKGYILEIDDEYPKYLPNLHSDLPFLSERRKSTNAISLFLGYMTKKFMLLM